MEKDNELYNNEGTSYTTEFRQLDTRLGRWLSTDPVLMPFESPYAVNRNNPIILADPYGDCPDCPNDEYEIKKGETFWELEKRWGFRENQLQDWNPGVDPTNLQIGQKIKAFGFGDEGYAVFVDNQFMFSTNSENTGKEMKMGFISMTKELWEQRPDADGKLTLEEANKWYREEGGEPLFVDASKIDIGFYKEDAKNKGLEPGGEAIYNNFLYASTFGTKAKETGYIYGTIRLQLGSDGETLTLGKNGYLDEYNFEYHKGRYMRNIATWFGRQIAGEGEKFNIYTYGTAKLTSKPKPIIEGGMGSAKNNNTGEIYYWNPLSDSNLKTQINIFDSSVIEDIFNLNIYTYYFKDSAQQLYDLDSSIQYGFLAQEVEKIFPNIIGKNNMGNLYISFNELVPLMFKANKEQNEKLEELQNELLKIKELLNNIMHEKE